MIPHFWEPEETVGHAWHGLVKGLDAEPAHPDAVVRFEEVRATVGVLFRAAGGEAGVEVVATARRVSRHRMSRGRRLGADVDHVTEAAFDGLRLALPSEIALFPSAQLNRDCYLWLAAVAGSVIPPARLPRDPLAADKARLDAVLAAERRVAADLPGLAPKRARLGEALAALRRVATLPADEKALETAIRSHLTGAPTAWPEGRALDDYRPFRPVVFWPAIEPLATSTGSTGDETPDAGSGAGETGEKRLAAERRAGDQADRKDPLILNRFESILSWAEFLNINRRVEDDDEGAAKKAAQDLDKVTLARNSKTAATKLKFHLDLSPADVDTTRLIGERLLPEWDWRRRAYIPDHVSLYESEAVEGDATVFDRPRARRRIAAVKRQFEALRPRRVLARRQQDGFEIDLDEAIRAAADRLARGDASDRLSVAIRNDERDLAVAVLMDVSRSTESAVGDRQVIEVAREALVALSEGIDLCGDQVSIHAFSSLRRSRVMVDVVKRFDEPVGAAVRARIAGLTPKHYTRLGAAIRHVSEALEARAASRRLLIVITDGKPNDLDHYEGRHGAEDTRRAVTEARRRGHAVFAITVDVKAREYLPHLFGANGYAVVRDADRLVDALPAIYAQVVGA